MRLVIVSHTPHYRKDGAVVGWAATVREIDRLASIFEEVVHLALTARYLTERIQSSEPSFVDHLCTPFFTGTHVRHAIPVSTSQEGKRRAEVNAAQCAQANSL